MLQVPAALEGHTHTKTMRDDKHTVLVFHRGQLASLAWRHKVSFSEISSDNFTFPWRHFKLESLTAHSAETTPQHRQRWHRLLDWFRPSKVIRVLLMRVCVHVWTMNQSFNLAADEAANNPAETGRRRRERERESEQSGVKQRRSRG